MITFLRKRNSFSLKDSRVGFTVLEFLIVLGIIAIMFGVIVAMKSPFQERMALRNSALALSEDLRIAQAYAIGQKDSYEYYGVRFFNNLGVDMLQAGDLRDGWKIVRYEPQGIGSGFDVDALPQPLTVIKSSEYIDGTVTPDRTFFERGVTFAAASELRPNPTVPPRHSVVFNSRGEATTDGQNFLGVAEDQISLTGFGNAITITITPRTGHVEVP
jgi:type II secretory pathway pseudopilin PulG